MNMQYGCIGEHLTHSFSKEIHGALSDYPYELKEISPEALDEFMTQRDFRAINVTIPYKQAVIPYLKEIDKQAAMIGAVNTIINRDGQLYGYNTDFGGLSDLICRTGMDLQGKKVLILGTGGTSNTALAVAQSMGAACVYKVSRSEKPGAVTYEEVIAHHLDAQILINTTPRGMFSREAGMAIDPALFPQLQGAVDVVYNPLRTQFIQKVQDMGVAAAGGLYMLVRQAVLASQIFLDTQYSADVTEQVYRKLQADKESIVLTGMPGSGKSTVGKLLAENLGRPYFDTDTLITEKTGNAPGEIISDQGEKAFRDMETAVIRELSLTCGAVIATGGGAVLRKENIDALKQNGKIFFLDRPVEQLLPTQDRPLSSTKEAIYQRYKERYPIYTATADVVIANDTSAENAALTIERSFLP